jgi:hypothetical protein
MKIRTQLFWKRLFTFCFALIVLKAALAGVLRWPAVQAQTARVDFARDIEPLGLYWYRLNPDATYTKHVID